MKKKDIFGTAAFLILTCVIFFSVQHVFGISNKYSEHSEMMFEGYYDKEADSIDAIFIGNSHIYRYWQNAFAWKEYGMSAMSLSVSDMPASAVKNMAIEAMKNQKPKVLVLDATAFANEDSANNKIYLILNNMKFSMNKIDTIRDYCESNDITGEDQLQYYFPMIQFHSRWKEINKKDFIQMYPSYLNSCYLKDFLSKTIEETEHIDTDLRTPIGKQSKEALLNLLDWCKKQDVKIRFLAVPVLRSEDKMGMINTVGDIVKEHGFEFVNYNEQAMFDSFDFDITVDFQDINHTNINGSYKFTKVYGKALMEEYGLTDHRNEEKYSEWNEEADAYYDEIKDYFIY